MTLHRLPHTHDLFTLVLLPTLIVCRKAPGWEVGLMWLNWHLKWTIGEPDARMV